MQRAALWVVVLLAFLTAGWIAGGALSSESSDPQGHLVLQIEGDARSLEIVRVTPKSDPCGLQRGIESPFELVVSNADTEFGRYPLDLSHFDLDPAHRGQPLRVEGCMVIDTRVVTLANVPHWPLATKIDIERDGIPMGSLAGAELFRLVQEGRQR